MIGLMAAVLLLVGIVRASRRDAPPVRDVERALWTIVAGSLLVLAVTVTVLVQFSPDLAFGVAVVGAAYVVYCLPRSTRRTDTAPP